ncbi:MAG: hypothetical protein QOG73_3891 [Acetobacteraceae bacterium]|jgi:hypothetical protein|nr:hypothetical protein [Acetobacteraceae bacterium]
MLKQIVLAGVALMIGNGAASAKELKSIGISLGSMGNPPIRSSSPWPRGRNLKRKRPTRM